MSYDSGNRSLAPTGAEDDTLSGTHSVIALLRLSKEVLSRHLTVIAGIHSHFTEGSPLSTVMGNLDLRSTRTSERKALIAELPVTMKWLDDTVVHDPENGPETVLAVRKELHELIRSAISQQLSSPKMMEVATMITKTLEEDLINPIEKSIKVELHRAISLLNQCLILSTGAKTGQPWKKDQAIKTFDEDLRFLVEKVGAMKTCKGYLDEARNMSNDLRAQFSIIEQISDKDTSDKLTKLEQQINHNVLSTNAIEKEIVARFNDGAQILSKDRSKKLVIPADTIEKSRGPWVRAELPPWIKQHTDILWPIIPWIYRIMNDYDALKGEYWKPPTYEQCHHAVPEQFRDEWIRANRTLSATLRPILGELFMAMFTCTFSFGANSLKTAKADEDNGLELIFALVTLSSPNSSTYRDSICRQMHNCADLCKTGSPVDFVKQVRICLLECIRLNIQVRWHVAKQIIDIMAQRHNLYARDLKTPREICQDSEDCAPEFDALLTKICDIHEDIKANSGDTWWTAGTGTALMANTTAKPNNAGSAHEWCRYGRDCNKKDSGMCKRQHDPNVTKAQPFQSKGGKGKGKGKANSKGKGNPSKADPARCAKQSCTEKANPKGELCGGCYIKAKAEGGYTNRYGKQIPVVVNDNSDRQKARKAAKASGKATANSALNKDKDDDENDSLDPPVHGVYVTLDQWNLMNKNPKVKTSNITDTNMMSGIGEELGKHISGPASWKQRLVSEFMKDDLNKTMDISNIILNFLEFVKKK